jgi:predicted nucleic acid-binding protein
MTTSKIFVDSNIILYLFDVDKTKRYVAEQLLLKKPLVSAQVLTEVANVCKRRFKYSKEQILNLWSDLLSDCILTFTDTSTFKLAIELSKKYDFQVYDSLIVASALNSDCKILYSEDMQDLLQVENKLIITNPFR